MSIIPVYHFFMKSVSYIIWTEGVDYCILIDCGEWKTIRPLLNQMGKRVDTVLLTHGHSDHICGLLELLHIHPNVKIGTTIDGFSEMSDPRKNLSFYHRNPFVVTEFEKLILCDGDVLHFEGLCDIEVISTPGHDISCLSYLTNSVVFTGDAYIPGIKTFAGFSSSNKNQAINSNRRLMKLELDGYTILSGHHID